MVAMPRKARIEDADERSMCQLITGSLFAFWGWWRQRRYFIRSVVVARLIAVEWLLPLLGPK